MMPMNIYNLQFFNTNFIVPINEESEFGDENFERQDEECTPVGEEASEETREQCCSKALNPTKDKCCAHDGETADLAENCCVLDSILDDTGKCKTECPAMGVNPKAIDRGATEEESWQECAVRCSERPECRYWTYIKDTEAAGDYRKSCYTMPGYEFTTKNDNAIMGAATCTEKCKEMGEAVTDETEHECCSKMKHEDQNICCGKVGEEASEDTREQCCSKALNPTKDKCCAHDGETATWLKTVVS